MQIIGIHTHDRITYRRCRRKWDFSSPLRRHLASTSETNTAQWFGTGIHFALEDFHGYQKFSSPILAYQAYYNVYKRHFPELLPEEHEELLELAFGMLEYYQIWLHQRDLYKTLWLDGKPQLEVEFSLPLPELSDCVGYPVVYQGAFDRIVVDEDDRWWVQDYKTRSHFDTPGKLELDPQISAYVWAAEKHYQHEIQGVLFLQMKKAFPKYPKILANSRGLSVDKRQATTYNLFKLALEQEGLTPPYPKQYVEYLDFLLEQETEEGDRYIRWDKIYRNEAAIQHEEQCILAEGLEMLNPELPIYPNPTRDCEWDCEFRSVCLAMMDGSDWEWLLNESFIQKEVREDWRSLVVWKDPELDLLS